MKTFIIFQTYAILPQAILPKQFLEIMKIQIFYVYAIRSIYPSFLRPLPQYLLAVKNQCAYDKDKFL